MMTSMNFRGGMAAVAVTAFVMFAPAAQADGTRDKIVKTLVDVIKGGGAKDVTYETITGDDARFAVNTIKVTAEKDGKETTTTIEKATFVGAKIAADGGYTADEIVIDALEAEGDGGSGSAKSVRIKSVVVPSLEKIAAKDPTARGSFDRLDLTELEITDENDKSYAVASIGVATSNYVDGIPHKTAIEVKGAVIPLDEADENAKEVIALGYKDVTLDVNIGGAWDEKAGRVAVSEVLFDAKNMGVLKLAFAIGGLTSDVAKALKEAEGNNDKQMELLQALTIENATVRFDNASVVEKMLDMQAKKDGIKRDALVTKLTTMLPMLTASLNNKAFEKKIADAAGAFLKAPKSLTASVKPAQPVPVSQIIGTVMVAPQTLPTVLGADIVANK